MTPEGDIRIDFPTPVNFPFDLLDRFKDGGAALLENKVTLDDGRKVSTSQLTSQMILAMLSPEDLETL